MSAVEHSSIMESAKKLEDNGFDVVYIMPREDGTIHKEDVLEKVDENTILVSVMCVNNETGAIMNVTDIFSAVKAKNSDVICTRMPFRRSAKSRFLRQGFMRI